ncbi:hypothetical protein NECAME_17207 [Necator americanus]|uniref:Protein kinase domain-containing protein n=1 Tax=Necator americanus TaxID=51031 RepID=W2TT17_NECAM|nr:hypothetical protein NECAME_17207 [Necator americanus]ETN84207.1 hypothetical protein NECAME_17207 [Necator americanus]
MRIMNRILADIWSAGCVLGEMVKGNVLFPGRDTKHQLKLIRRALGSPTDADMRSMKVPKPPDPLAERVAGTGLAAVPQFHVVQLNRIKRLF